MERAIARRPHDTIRRPDPRSEIAPRDGHNKDHSKDHSKEKTVRRNPSIVSILRVSFVVLCCSWAALDAPLRSQPPEATDTSVRMRLDLEYLPIFPYNESPGDLFLYLDGDLLAWVSRGGQFAPTPPVRFERWVESGEHVMRLAAETHERQGKGWGHEARVSDVVVRFRLAPGGDGEIRLKLESNKQVFAKDKGPISYTVTQNGNILQNLERGGSDPHTWTLLCDDTEANLDPERKKIPKRIAKELEGCLRWPALWDELSAPPPERDAVRRILERYDYEPRTYKQIFE